MLRAETGKEFAAIREQMAAVRRYPDGIRSRTFCHQRFTGSSRKIYLRCEILALGTRGEALRMRNILLIELAGAVGLVVVTGLKADDKKVTFGADTLVVTRSVYMSAAALQVRLLPFLTP